MSDLALTSAAIFLGCSFVILLWNLVNHLLDAPPNNTKHSDYDGDE